MAHIMNIGTKEENAKKEAQSEANMKLLAEIRKKIAKQYKALEKAKKLGEKAIKKMAKN